MNKERQQFSIDDKKEIKRQYDLCCSKTLFEREHGETLYSRRDPFQRDYARVLYSSSFRRLQGKMQILGINSSAFYRNRLTHSLEVSQIARSIAYDLARLCDGKAMYYSAAKPQIDLCCLEAAALCHDIGHPAFGHSGEHVLDDIAKKSSLRFEGNAQNFRVLRTLEKYDPETNGLNLTWRTLLAINKYFVKEDVSAKKFMYNEDYDKLKSIREKTGLLNQRTLDVQIIELADDIAYAVHDLEDALTYRSFNIDELCYTLKVESKALVEKNKSITQGLDNDAVEISLNKFNEIVKDARETASKSNSHSTLQEYSQVFRKKLVSQLTNSLVKNITLDVVSKNTAQTNGTLDSNKELCLGQLRPLCKLLKDAIFDCVTRDEEIALYEKRGEIVLRSLYEAFIDSSVNKKNMLIPPDYRYNAEPKENVLGVIDFLAGMMDTYAIGKYEELFGTRFDEIKISGFVNEGNKDKIEKAMLI